MRFTVRGLALPLVFAAAAGAQSAPPLNALTASRALVVPAQEVVGAPTAAVWLARFDSVFTARLEAGGIGNGWAYARDAVRHARMNPTYLTDPHTLGAQPLKNDRVREGFALPEPFAGRVRTYVAVAGARVAVVPVVARLDTARAGRRARMQITVVDSRGSRVVWTGFVEASYDGTPAAAADSLAYAAARLFVAGATPQPAPSAGPLARAARAGDTRSPSPPLHARRHAHSR